MLFVFAQVFLAQFLNTGVMFLIVNANANFPALRAIGLLNGQFHEARAVATSINFIFVFCISISISIAMLSAASCVNFRWIHWVCDKSYMTRLLDTQITVQWYVVVGVSVCLTILINIFVPHIAPLLGAFVLCAATNAHGALHISPCFVFCVRKPLARARGYSHTTHLPRTQCG